MHFLDAGRKYWIESLQTIEPKTDWKIHLYADSPEEWADVAQLAMPYLSQNKHCSFKTVRDFEHLAMLRESKKYGDAQKGKAFTIYFENEKAFLDTARDLETLFDNSGLHSSGKVKNEAQIGNSGFISYRNALEDRLSSNYKPVGMKDPYIELKQKENPNEIGINSIEVTPDLGQDSNIDGEVSTTKQTQKSFNQIKEEILLNSNIIPILKDYISNCQSLDEYNLLIKMLRNKQQKDIQYLTLLNTPEDKMVFNDLIEIGKDNPQINVFDSIKFYALKKDSPKSKQYYRNIIELVKDGTLDVDMLRVYAGGSLDKRTVNDVNLLIKAKRENLTQQQIKDLYIPRFEKLTLDNLKNIENGGVFEFDGKLMLKFNDEKVGPLRISKDTYFELFQPGYYVKQRAAGKCYLYSTILTALENPFEKANIINKCFRENNGTLNVCMPKSKVSINVDLKNIDASIKTDPYYSKGSKGVNLLEQAFEKHEVYEQSQKMISFLQTKIADPNSGIDIEKAMEILDDLTQNPANPHYVLFNPEATDLNKEFTFDDIISLEDAKQKGIPMANPQDLNTPDLFYGVFEGNAGHAAQVFNFGLSPFGPQNSYVKMLLNDPKTGNPQIPDKYIIQCKDMVMTAATRKSGNTVESVINQDLGILSSHAYACSLKIINNKPYMKVINPHNSSSPLLLNLETFRKFFHSITINNI